MEVEILIEIRDSEKKGDELIERAKREKDEIIRQTAADSLRLLSAKEEEIRKAQEKKIMDFREKIKFVREEKLGEGKAMLKQIKLRAEKNIPKAVEFAMKKFDEMIQNA